MIGAGVQDRDGGGRLLEQVPEARYPELLTVFADAAYRGRLEEIARDEHALNLMIVPKLQGQDTFVVLPKRWIVERTVAWLMCYRRLRADYETHATSSRAWILLSAIHRMTRRLAPLTSFTGSKGGVTLRPTCREGGGALDIESVPPFGASGFESDGGGVGLRALPKKPAREPLEVRIQGDRRGACEPRLLSGPYATSSGRLNGEPQVRSAALCQRGAGVAEETTKTVADSGLAERDTADQESERTLGRGLHA